MRVWMTVQEKNRKARAAMTNTQHRVANIDEIQLETFEHAQPT